MRDRNPMSLKPPLRPEGAKTQAIGYTKPFSTQKAQDYSQSTVARGDASRAKSNMRKAPGTLLAVIDSETTSVYSSHCESSSESDAITEDSTRPPSVAPPKLLRRSRYETSMRKKVVLSKNGGDIIKRREIIKSLGKEASESQDKVKASALCLRGGISELAFQNGNLWDDTTSTTQEDESLCSSGKLSGKKTFWTCSTCTEEDSQQRDLSPSERPAKKSCGDRASSLQPSREAASVWNSVERITSKSSYNSDCKLDESNESANVYETGSAIKAVGKDVEERHNYTRSQELTSLQDSSKDEKQKRDTDRLKVQETGRQAHAQSVLEISAKIIGPELFHAEIAWIASRGTQRILGPQDKNDESIQQNLQNLNDQEPSNGSNLVKTKEHISHNRLREAVEAVWKTSLGTKGGGGENQDGENALLGHCYWDQNNEENLNVQLLNDKTPRDKLQEQSFAQEAAPYKQISIYEQAWKETSGTDERHQKNYFEKEPSAVDENASAYKRSWLEALGKNNNDHDDYSAKEPSDKPAIDEKISTYKAAWQETFGTKNEHNDVEKEPSDLIFWSKQRDHEDLKALVAREEGLQKEQKDLALIQLASEGRARGAAAEQKSHLHETSAEAAEEIHAMLNERAVFHSKFKEELDRGVTDKFLEQELPHLQMPTIESEEIHLRVIRTSLQESLRAGTWEVRRSVKESLPDGTWEERRRFQESLPEGTWEVRSSFQESSPDRTSEFRKNLQESLPEGTWEVEKTFQESLPEGTNEERRGLQESLQEGNREVRRSLQESFPAENMEVSRSLKESLVEEIRDERRCFLESFPEETREARRSFQELLPEETREVRRGLKESLPEEAMEVRRSFQKSFPEETEEVRKGFQESLPEETREVRRSLQKSFPEEAVEVRRSSQKSIREEMSPQEAIQEGTTAIWSPHQEPRMNPMLMHSGPGPSRVQLKWMPESESRIAAEAKASYFEACAKAAEKRMNSLLDERNWYYKRFVEEVEYNSDMKRLQQLMEIDKARQERHGKPQKPKLDVRLLVAASVADEKFDDEDSEDWQGACQLDGMHDTSSCQSKPKELLQENTDWQSDGLDFAKCQQELEKTMSDGKGLGHDLTNKPDEELSHLEKDKEFIEEGYISESSIPRYGERVDCEHEFANLHQESEKNISDMKGLAQKLRGNPDEEITEENLTPVSSISKYGDRGCHYELTSVPRYVDSDANLKLRNWQQELEKNKGDTKGLGHRLKDKSKKMLSDLNKNKESIGESYTSASHFPRYGGRDVKHEHITHNNTIKHSQPELEKNNCYGKGLAHDLQGHLEKDSCDNKKDEETIEENCMLASPIPRYGDRNPKREKAHEKATYKSTGQKNEKKRPLSPIKSSKAEDWKSQETAESIETEQCSVTRRSSFECSRSPRSSQESNLAPKACNDFEEDAFDLRKSSNPPPNNCAVLTPAASVTALPIPNKWKKQTKAELHRIIQQQERTWKMAENAVADLARRLLVLENYKRDLQDTLQRSRDMGKTDCLFSRLEKNLEEFPGGFNILYSCPIFENQKVEEGTSKNLAQKRCMSPNLSSTSNNYEIQEHGVDRVPAQKRCMSLNLSKISNNYEIQEHGVDRNPAQKRCMSPKGSQISESNEIEENGFEKNFSQKRCMSPRLSQLSKNCEIQENGADKNPTQRKCITPNVSQMSKDYEIKEDRVEKNPSQKRCISPKESQIKSYEIHENGVDDSSSQNSWIAPKMSQMSKHHKILENGVGKNIAQERCMSPKVSQMHRSYELQDNGVEKNSAQESYISPNVSQISKDYEIQLLKAEIAQLRNEISKREQDSSPQVQSTNFLSSSEAVLRYRDPMPLDRGSEGQHSATEKIVTQIEPEIPDDPFSDPFQREDFVTKEVPKGRLTYPSKRHHSAPEVHAIETELELPDDSFYKKKLCDRKETPTSRSYSPSKRHHSAPELTIAETQPELLDDPSQTESSSATREAPRNRSVSLSRDDRHAHSDDFFPPRGAHGLNGSWSPHLDEEYGAQIPIPISENNTNSQPQQLGCPNNCHNHITDDGNLQAARTVVKKLSHIFQEEEAKFKNLSASNKGPSQLMDPHGFYLALLKRLSQRLTQFCHNLDDDFPTHQNCQKNCHQVKSTDKKFATTTEGLNFPTYIEVEREQKGEAVKPNMTTTHKPPFITQRQHELEGGPAEPRVALQESERKEPVNPRTTLHEAEWKEPTTLRAALQIAEREMEEELQANSFLTEKLENQAKHISEVIAENVEELVRKDQKLSYEQQVNNNLVRDMAKTEKSLADLRSRNKELVTDLDCQLQTARNEVTSLQNTVNALKIDLKQKENLASYLKGERSKTQVQTQDLKSQIQVVKRENDAIAEEKLELMDGIKQTRTEIDEQNHRIREFITINEDLIAVAQSKENEVKTLTKMVTSLKQSMIEKSDETKGLLGETERLSQDLLKVEEDVKKYTNHREFLQSKLEDTEQELASREQAVERLTVHLGKTIEGQHVILEEKEQLLLSLNKAQSNERELDAEVQHLKTVIQDLEEKLNCMDAEMKTLSATIEDTKAKRLDEIELQKEELRNRVDQLEDEIMEKEGQIAILTTSTP